MSTRQRLLSIAALIAELGVFDKEIERAGAWTYATSGLSGGHSSLHLTNDGFCRVAKKVKPSCLLKEEGPYVLVEFSRAGVKVYTRVLKQSQPEWFNTMLGALQRPKLAASFGRLDCKRPVLEDKRGQPIALLPPPTVQG